MAGNIKKALWIMFFLSLCTILSYGIDEPKRLYKANPINPTPPIIDGVLDDKIWQKGEWEGNFTQHEPYNGVSPHNLLNLRYTTTKISFMQPSECLTIILRQ